MEPHQITLIADGQQYELSTYAATVGEVLAEAGVRLNAADKIDPPLTTVISTLTEGKDHEQPLEITVIRVTESIEVVPESIPFSRRIVRTAEMSPDDPPRIVQTGKQGFREVTVRILFHDGLEVERWPTDSAVIEPPQDEIIMIGVGSGSDDMILRGRLAYIDDGRAIILEGSTSAPRQLEIPGRLDGRVFQQSPGGKYLLYTIAAADDEDQSGFRNELWLTSIDGREQRSLQIENVLWAAWDPSKTDASVPRIAYTTARSISQPPGWEANNDLWVLDISTDGTNQPTPVRVLETYAVASGWWGGNYAWSPSGERLAYAFAGEVGLLDMPLSDQLAELNNFTAIPEPGRTVLHQFPEYETAADWAWIPDLSWSADGRLLAFTSHRAEAAPASSRFDLWLADIENNDIAPIIENVGIWSVLALSSEAVPDTRLAFTQAVDPQEGQESDYILRLADWTGQNAQQLYPPNGEAGSFGRANQSLAWESSGTSLAFIYEETLHILNLATGTAYQAGLDDTGSSHPSWAPYSSSVNR